MFDWLFYTIYFRMNGNGTNTKHYVCTPRVYTANHIRRMLGGTYMNGFVRFAPGFLAMFFNLSTQSSSSPIFSLCRNTSTLTVTSHARSRLPHQHLRNADILRDSVVTSNKQNKPMQHETVDTKLLFRICVPLEHPIIYGSRRCIMQKWHNIFIFLQKCLVRCLK